MDGTDLTERRQDQAQRKKVLSSPVSLMGKKKSGLALCRLTGCLGESQRETAVCVCGGGGGLQASEAGNVQVE